MNAHTCEVGYHSGMDISLFITLFHIIGVAIGVGGATVSDVLFFRAMADKRISRDEIALLHTLGMMLWVGLFILFASGLGFLALQLINTGTVTYLGEPWFQSKMTIIAVLFTNALVMHWYIFPFMYDHLNQKLNYETMRPKLALFATTGVVSIASWYTALTLGVTRGLDFSYGLILNLYFAILVFGALCAYILLSVAVFTKPVPKKSRSVSTHYRPAIAIIVSIILGLTLVTIAWYAAQSIDAPEATSTEPSPAIDDTVHDHSHHSH